MDSPSPFILEWLALNRIDNMIAISAVCNSHCLFCSNEQNPFAIEKNLFRDVEDIKLQLSLMPAHNKPIRMSDSLPGRISEGEAFLHPKFFEIIELVRRKFPFSKLCFTTNGSMLTEPFLQRLAEYRPVDINFAMHSARPELWARIFGRKERDALRALAAPALARKLKMEISGSIVTLPAICGWDDIEQTYATLVGHGAKAMILWWPGYTRTASDKELEDVRCDLDEFVQFSESVREKYPVPVTVVPDMSGTLPASLLQVAEATTRGNPRNGLGMFREVVWLVSEAAEASIRSWLAEHAPALPNVHRVHPVPNETYGGNIIVAGLLMVDDFILAGKQALHQWPDAELVLLPSEAFDGLNRDLKQAPVTRVAEALERPTWLVDENGTIDPLLDRIFTKRVDRANAPRRVVDAFSSALGHDAKIDDVLQLVDAFPIATTGGLLERTELQQALSNGTFAGLDRARRRTRTLELLDETHALSLDDWSFSDRPGTLSLSTFLVKQACGWKIDGLRWVSGE